MVQAKTVLSDPDLIQLNSRKPVLRVERNTPRNNHGSQSVRPTVDSFLENRVSKAMAYLHRWVSDQSLGTCFSRATRFKFPMRAMSSPAVAFIEKGRLPNHGSQSTEGFIPLVPDFVIEFRSRNDRLDTLQAKMHEYTDNGVRLGWLIDRHNHQAFVYQADGTVTQYPATAILSGEAVVPGFKLVLKRLL